MPRRGRRSRRQAELVGDVGVVPAVAVRAVVGPPSVMTGAVLSIWKSALVTPVAVLPARSVQAIGGHVDGEALTSRRLGLGVAREGRAQAASGPEMPASRLNSLVTSVLYQPLLFGSVVGPSSVMTGAVLSI